MENELTDEDREELARLIKEGYTSGRLDGEGYCISRSLKTEKWQND